MNSKQLITVALGVALSYTSMAQNRKPKQEPAKPIPTQSVKTYNFYLTEGQIQMIAQGTQWSMKALDESKTISAYDSKVAKMQLDSVLRILGTQLGVQQSAEQARQDSTNKATTKKP